MMKFKLLAGYLQNLPDNIRSIFLIAVYGASAGLTAVAFLLLTNFVFDHTFIALAKRSLPEFLIWSFVIIISSSLLVGLLLNFLSKEANGSGVPQLKGAYWNDLGFVKWRPVWVKFIAGVLSIGGGASLGREGPTIYIAGGTASNIAGMLGIPKQSRRHATALGAAAGLAAAFNTPLAAITFVLEELIGDMNSRFLGGVVLSSVVGAFVVYAIIGKQPAFDLPEVDALSWWVYLIVPLVAAFAAWLGMIFQRETIRWRSRVKQNQQVPFWVKPAIGGFITWMIGAAVYYATGKIGVFGLGYHDLSSALNVSIEWKVAALLVVAKLAATIACYGWEGCGGIFAPSLFIGGMSGLFIGGLAGQWMPVTHSDGVILAAVGMSSCFGALVRAPMTSLLMVFEMTHQFSMVPALMIGVIVSQVVARYRAKHNFYDTLLLQDGHELIKIKPPRDFESWRNLQVEMIANKKPVVVDDPSETSLIALLANYPYQCFPVVIDGILKGVVTRGEIAASLQQKREFVVEPVMVCRNEETLRNMESKFIQSPTGMVVVVNNDNTSIIGLITLHDLLRAQAAIVE
ncbi:MAG TPA: chloride channel protein [Syntrophales bacterium]|jgi:CIC family chloride channel protein|nr:chloride channel protein [Syntrophales bacterium]HOU77416.1 chloride channel protein [Syntrophales bacterium]HPC33476.1 chloride channel protein [Syntrophales bacterium]HQG35083.1 chloride channel protein [Syntrophales bacterium]HQI35985.1 chloride channel protein [Syntrophales bacterium]